MAQVVIILGSKSDVKVVEESGMLDILNESGVDWELSVISAHRNPGELADYCRKKEEEAFVFIGVAGMAAALPGNIAAYTQGKKLVIGVPLPSREMPDAMDALLSMVRMPSGRPVAVCGTGETGLCNSAILTCQIIALYDSKDEDRFSRLMLKTNPPAQIALMSSERR